MQAPDDQTPVHTTQQARPCVSVTDRTADLPPATRLQVGCGGDFCNTGMGQTGTPTHCHRACSNPELISCSLQPGFGSLWTGHRNARADPSLRDPGAARCVSWHRRNTAHAGLGLALAGVVCSLLTLPPACLPALLCFAESQGEAGLCQNAIRP